MRRSDVFESFVKIALEKGLISEGEHAEQTEKNTDNPRWDSLSEQEIAKLYNNKSEGYTRNIIEQAHPESLVIAPSYDKLHGLVENENERQDITLNIIMKEPYGHPNQKKYAEKEFVMSLVRLGNDLDSRNLEELRVLADTCLQQATVFKKKAKFEKTALPILIPIVIALLGAMYAYDHITTQEGVTLDYQKLSDAIKSAQTQNTNWEVGYQYSPEFLNMLADLQKKALEVNNAVTKANEAMSKISKPKTAQELAVLSNQPEAKEVASAYESLKTTMDNLGPYFTQVVQNLNDPAFRERAIKDRGFFSGLLDKTKILHNPQSDAALFSNDFAELTATLNNYVQDVQKIESSIQKAKSFEQKAANDLSAGSQQPAPAQQSQVDPNSLIPTQQNLGTPAAPPKAGPEMIAQQEKAPWDTIKVPNSIEGLMG